jgi:hypothetical protein
MKKLALSLIIILTAGLSVNAVAQKSTAFLYMKTSKQVVDARMSLVTFQLNNVSDEITKLKFQDSFKATQQVLDVNGSLQAGNMATFSMKMPKAGSVQTLQSMFASAGIEAVNIDGTVVETKKMADYIKAHSEKK